MSRISRVKSETRAVCIVCSAYNASVTGRMLEGAVAAAHAREAGEVEIVEAPGSFELPALCLAAARTRRFAGVVALGCIIKGETIHDRVIADAVARGIVDVTLTTGVPVAFGVLTVDTPEQAEARAGGAQGNKGAEAMDALLDTLEAMEALQSGVSRVGGGSKRTASLPDKAKKSAGRSGETR